jgi:hypothetical protein
MVLGLCSCSVSANYKINQLEICVIIFGYSAGQYQLVLQVPISTWNIYPSRLGKWSVCKDPRESFVDKGDAKVMLSAVMSISIFCDDIIVRAAAVGPYQLIVVCCDVVLLLGKS